MGKTSTRANRFWETKTLAELSRDEWEALCDGCGLCCLHKLEDVETGRIHYTDVACRLFEPQRCRCRSYAERHRLVRDCIRLSPTDPETLKWMPTTCAYRLRHEGKPLPSWHPLVSGDPESVHRAGVSVRGRTVPEQRVDLRRLEQRVVTWVGTGKQSH
jgi:uncharacterized protein